MLSPHGVAHQNDSAVRFSHQINDEGDAVIRRRLAALAAASALLGAGATHAAEHDPIGDLLLSVVTGSVPGSPGYKLKATLYHAGAKGVGSLDSLGCKVVAMRTAAVDKTLIPRRTILFIKETVGLPMPNGQKHDGFWYASDVGGAIKGERIDLYTGHGGTSMKPMMPLNLSKLSAVKVGEFKGCPPK
jgi:3D (Asp-Asp-Asp) domain-containing protein